MLHSFLHFLHFPSQLRNVFVEMRAELVDILIALRQRLVDGVKHSIDGRVERLVDGEVFGWVRNLKLFDELVHLNDDLRLGLERVDTLLNLVEEGEALDELQCGGRFNLQLELRVLQLRNETVHLLARLHRKYVVDDVEAAVGRRNHEALQLLRINKKHAKRMSLHDAFRHLDFARVRLQRFRKEWHI